MTTDHDLLQELLDERDIRNVLIAIARTVDQKDFDATAALYAVDGELLMPWGSHQGREGLADYIRNDLGSFPGMHHVSAGHEITVAPDRQTARARMTLLATHVLDDDGTAFTTLGGHYDIDLVRRDAVWELHRVRLYPAFRFQSGGGGAGADEAPAAGA